MNLKEDFVTLNNTSYRTEMFPITLPESERGVLFRAYCDAEFDPYADSIYVSLRWQRWYIVGETECFWKLARTPDGTVTTRRAKRARKQFAFESPADALESLKKRTLHRLWHSERNHLNALAVAKMLEVT